MKITSLAELWGHLFLSVPSLGLILRVQSHLAAGVLAMLQHCKMGYSVSLLELLWFLLPQLIQNLMF